MKLLWTWRTIDAPADAVWALLVDPEHWPAWGPSVRRAELDGDGLGKGTTGTVYTAVGIPLPFEITEFEPARRWAWRVARIRATDHVVEPDGDRRCRVGFGVPWLAGPYLFVCRIALGRLHTIATTGAPP